MELCDIGIIETERCILRRFRESDAEALYEYAKDPAVGPDAGWKPHADLEESKRILGMFMNENDVLAITLRENDRVIGSVGLHRDGARRLPEIARMLGYVLSREYWGRGLMTECAKAVIKTGFEKMGLEIISVSHFSFNNRSKRVIEKCGFKYEGTLRMAFPAVEGYYGNGRIYDEVCYSMLRTEFND